MSNKTLENLINLNYTMALIFGMIVKGKIGLIGVPIFFFSTCVLTWIYQKRTEPKKKMGLIVTIFMIVLVGITFTFCYLAEFKPRSKITDIFMFLFIIWSFGGLIIAYIIAIVRKRRQNW